MQKFRMTEEYRPNCKIFGTFGFQFLYLRDTHSQLILSIYHTPTNYTIHYIDLHFLIQSSVSLTCRVKHWPEIWYYQYMNYNVLIDVDIDLHTVLFLLQIKDLSTENKTRNYINKLIYCRYKPWDALTNRDI